MFENKQLDQTAEPGTEFRLSRYRKYGVLSSASVFSSRSSTLHVVVKNLVGFREQGSRKRQLHPAKVVPDPDVGNH